MPYEIWAWMRGPPQQSSARVCSAQAVKWLLWGAHSVWSSWCCRDAMLSMSRLLSWQQVFSVPLFRSTATDDCSVSLFSRLDTRPSFSIQSLLCGVHVAALTVLCLAATLVPREHLFSCPRKPSSHFIASLLHGTDTSCREKTSKHPTAYIRLIAKSCFTLENKWE